MGNTILNDIPVLRIDQIWVSRDFETVQSFAVRSNVSDHRIVVSDIRIKE
jgi:endonuclease/exonuclease/phosphatase family metal-dependent hydrolase